MVFIKNVRWQKKNCKNKTLHLSHGLLSKRMNPLCVLTAQVQVQDPDEAENGAVTLAVQMGIPRLDFRLNSSTGVLFSTAVLDRELIAQYQLRLVAFDAGQFPRTSTSTLTITGTDQNECHRRREPFQLQ